MSSLVFYGHHESGHSYKVALALSMLELPHEYRWVDIFAPRDARAADFRAASPYGEIPVLVIDGAPLAQSNAILLHLMRRTRRFGGETEERAEKVQQWLFWEANRVGISLGNYRALVKAEFGEVAPPGVLAWLKARFDFDVLERELSARPFLLGDAITVADLSCSAYLFLAHEAKIDLAPWNSVCAWLDRIRSTRGFADIGELLHKPNG
jgi:glutathione S-transferase